MILQTLYWAKRKNKIFFNALCAKKLLGLFLERQQDVPRSTAKGEQQSSSWGLVQVHDWGPKNPTRPLPSAEFKIVPKTTERTLKFSLAFKGVQAVGHYLALKLQIRVSNVKSKLRVNISITKNTSCLNGHQTPISHSYFKTCQDLTKHGLRRSTAPF